MQFAGKWRVKDPEMVWKSACLWVHFLEEIQKRTSVGEYQELRSALEAWATALAADLHHGTLAPRHIQSMLSQLERLAPHAQSRSRQREAGAYQGFQPGLADLGYSGGQVLRRSGSHVGQGLHHAATVRDQDGHGDRR